MSDYEDKMKREGEEFLAELKALLKKHNANLNLVDEGRMYLGAGDEIIFASSSGDRTYDEGRRVGFDIRLGKYFDGD